MLPKISGVEVTPSVTYVESSEQFWRKIRQIWRIYEPCKKTLGDRAFQVAGNKLPRSAREATNLESFKTLIKTFLFKESFQLS